MSRGRTGTFVITWAQTEVDGLRSAPPTDLRAGSVWSWTGEPVRVDGPADILPLGNAHGAADLQEKAASVVRRLTAGLMDHPRQLNTSGITTPLFQTGFQVTDGRAVWDVGVIDLGPGRKPLAQFRGEWPPRDRDLWVVQESLKSTETNKDTREENGVVCFTPGTVIATPSGQCDVADLRVGDRVQTKDNGCARIIWIGLRHISAARLLISPQLRPVWFRDGALGGDVPTPGLLVSPDHRVVLRGATARALYNEDEVLVAARDMVNDRSITFDHRLGALRYIHLMLDRHEILFANGVETESFYPTPQSLAELEDTARAALYHRRPDLRSDPQDYGASARRMLSRAEAAVMKASAFRRRPILWQ